MAGESRTVSVVSGEDVRMALVSAAGVALGAWGLYSAWHVAPVEKTLKMSQKIFYFHAPLGIWTIVLSVAAAVAGAAYLFGRRDARWDLACHACIEVGTLLCGVVLVTGSLWARPAWDDWFPLGEPRLTLMLVLFLLDIAYLVLRSSVDDPARRARFCSVLAVVGAFDAVLAYAAIHLWNTQHPRVITSSGVGLQEDMAAAFYTCIAALGLVTWAIVEARYRVGALRLRLEALEDRAGSDLET